MHRDIILCDNSHPFLRQTISCDGRQCSACHYLNLPVSQGPCILVQCIAVLLGFYSPYLNKALEIFPFSLQTCMTLNKHIVHCMSKFYNLSKPKHHPWRQMEVKLQTFLTLVLPSRCSGSSFWTRILKCPLSRRVGGPERWAGCCSKRKSHASVVM
jgi:hypothetical protein